MAVILSAAYLHDIGILEAEKKYGNTKPEQHEKEGPVIAKTILQNLGAKEELIDEVCDIIVHHHHPGTDESLNFKVVYDADLLENLDEKQKENPVGSKQLEDIIEQSFLTSSGREIAKDVLLK
jgi:HD superfamily phosphodiesterase